MVDTSPPTRLSATAAPFVPNPQAQQPYLGQTVAYYKLLETYGAQNGTVPSSNCSQVPAFHQPPARYEPRDVTKRKNRAYSNANAHLYREMIFSQHEFYVPPVSVTRRPSVVLPDGNYIGYYFKPEPASVQPTTMQPDEVKATSKIMSPSGDVDYCLQHPPPAGVLPLLPLKGPSITRRSSKRITVAPLLILLPAFLFQMTGCLADSYPSSMLPKLDLGSLSNPPSKPTTPSRPRA